MSPALSGLGCSQGNRKGGVRVLVATGASGGHIFPALGLLEALRKKPGNISTLLVLPRRNFVDPQQLCAFETRYLDISSVAMKLNLRLFTGIWNFLKGALESFFILARFRPDRVAAFGSIATIPIVTLSWLFRIKVILHEQNVIPGRANRFLLPFAERIAVSFAETKKYLPYPDKVILTGNPLRAQLKRVEKSEALRFFGLENNFTLLVMGGSQASSRLNRAIPTAIGQLEQRQDLQVIHLSGAKEKDFLQEQYRGLGIRAKVLDFLPQMHYGYCACDLMISRAGATTIAEAIYLRVPAIIVPYPFAYQHQLENARVLRDLGAALVIEDSQLDAQLPAALKGLLANPGRIQGMRAAYGSMQHLEAEDLLANEVLG
jgi:UDP-N-acetylglucosamine--N-acetylmuramyl-(pentapeptide) pyrophosphoryl-undecaprenol N-acetylglucosamine transferase